MGDGPVRPGRREHLVPERDPAGRGHRRLQEDDGRRAARRHVPHVATSTPTSCSSTRRSPSASTPTSTLPRAHLYLAKQMWEEANHCMSFEYVLETFPIDRDAGLQLARRRAVDGAQGRVRGQLHPRMTEQTLDITTTEGKQDFIRNLVAYNIILEGIWFYSGFMVALSFRQRNLLRNFGSLMDWVVRDEIAAPQVRHQPDPHGARGEPRDLQTAEFADEIRQMILDAVEMEEAVQPRPAPQRHPRPQRQLHQPVRQVPGRPSSRGARLRGRTTTCRTRPSGWRQRTTPSSS